MPVFAALSDVECVDHPRYGEIESGVWRQIKPRMKTLRPKRSRKPSTKNPNCRGVLGLLPDSANAIRWLALRGEPGSNQLLRNVGLAAPIFCSAKTNYFGIRLTRTCHAVSLVYHIQGSRGGFVAVWGYWSGSLQSGESLVQSFDTASDRQYCYVFMLEIRNPSTAHARKLR